MAFESACLLNPEERSSMQEDDEAEKTSAHSYGNARYSKSSRLCSKKQISELFQVGQFRSFGPLKFKYQLLKGDRTQYLISISKKVGNAPERNRLKRLIREVLRTSGKLNEFPMNCAIFINRPLKRKPALHDIQAAISRFFSSLSS